VAVSQAERKVTDLERNVGAAKEEAAKANEKLASLQNRHTEAMAQLQEAKRKSLQAQCPSVDQLPCGPLSLLEAARVKLLAELGPGCAGLVAELEALGTRATQVFKERKEAAEVAAKAETARLETAAAEDEVRRKEEETRLRQEASNQANSDDLMGLDIDSLDDEMLQSLDKDNAVPVHGAPAESLEEWRAGQRVSASKAQDLLRNLAEAKRAKLDPPPSPCGWRGVGWVASAVQMPLRVIPRASPRQVCLGRR
jgi:hypothetical protein